MLFSGKFGATESPSAAFVGLKRGPVALLLARFAGPRTHSGTTGALSEVWSWRPFAFFFEPTLTRSYCGHAPRIASLAKQPRYTQVTLRQIEELVESDELWTGRKRAGISGQPLTVTVALPWRTVRSAMPTNCQRRS